jgi:hypothetical protein
MLGEIRREVTEAIFAYDIPDFENLEASPELGELMEARLVDAFPMDDGMDDGFQPDKDADGSDGTSLLTHQHSRGGTPGQGNPDSPQNRAQRRSNKG